MKNKAFSRRLKGLMKEKHLTQRGLAAELEITEAAMSQYVSGIRVPQTYVVCRMAKALNTTTDYLLGLKDD